MEGGHKDALRAGAPLQGGKTESWECSGRKGGKIPVPEGGLQGRWGTALSRPCALRTGENGSACRRVGLDQLQEGFYIGEALE